MSAVPKSGHFSTVRSGIQGTITISPYHYMVNENKNRTLFETRLRRLDRGIADNRRMTWELWRIFIMYQEIWDPVVNASFKLKACEG